MSTSEAFERLHPDLQRWVYRQGWPALRPIQEASAEPILRAKADVILAAATASGKTEAAFLPILSSLADQPISRSIAVLCVSPLKALINDQFERLESLGAAAKVPVHRWHGDVSGTHKRRLISKPSGLLLITPESLEALFCRRGSSLSKLFSELRYVVIDELHAFIGSERGRQLQSLLHRLELVLRRRVPRVALSATLGDLSLAAEFLRPRRAEAVELIEDREQAQEVRLQVRGYCHRPSRQAKADGTNRGETGGEVSSQLARGDSHDIANDLFERLRGGHHLIFANRRQDVEKYADHLRKLCERLKVPNEFWPHHGSLSRELREDAERAINDKSRPTTLVATTTLELGIDIGAIESVAQIGPPPSVAALRQRVGRSGRQGDAAVLRIVIQESEITPDTLPSIALRTNLVQAIAMVELLINRWVEPPPPATLQLSTLVQQTLSVLAQLGGADAQSVWRALCQSGPFRSVDSALFGRFLRALGAADLIVQDGTGELILGLNGERAVDHYTFYAAFSSPEEYRLVTSGRTLGQLPIAYPLFEGLMLIFGGRRWQVLEVDEDNKIVELKPAAGGTMPNFLSSGGPPIDARVRQEMLAVYRSKELPQYIDRPARELLREAREWFERLDLGRTPLMIEGDSIALFPWSGDRVLDTLVLLLSAKGMMVSRAPHWLLIRKTSPEELLENLRSFYDEGFPAPVELARRAAQRQTEKFHLHLSDDLLIEDYAASRLDLPETEKTIRRILEQTRKFGFESEPLLLN